MDFDNLSKYGIKPTGCFTEDWGSVVNLESPRFPGGLVVQMNAGRRKNPSRICLCEPSVGFFERIFKKADPNPALERNNRKHMSRLIESEPGISDVEWYMRIRQAGI